MSLCVWGGGGAFAKNITNEKRNAIKIIRSLGFMPGELRVAAQIALLGVIGTQILGVCLTSDQDTTIIMRVFAEGLLSEAEQEAFDIATTEIIAYFSPKLRVEAVFIQNAEPPLECSGVWVFIRYGCQVV